MQPLDSPARDHASHDDTTSLLPLEPERFVQALADVVFGDPAKGVSPSPALRNRFLVAFAQGEFTRTQLIAYGIQHYQLVNNFTRDLEHALVCAPTRSVDDWRVKSFIAENLYEEYGEAVSGEDHPSLYRRFLRSAGITEVLGLDPMLPDEELAHTLERDLVLFRETKEFIDQHLRMAASFARSPLRPRPTSYSYFSSSAWKRGWSRSASRAVTTPINGGALTLPDPFS